LPEQDELAVAAREPARPGAHAPAPVLPAPAAADMSPPGLRRPVVAGVLGKAAEAVTLVLLATVVPRLLGPADYGRLSVVLTLVAVGSVALTLGGSTLLARYVPAAPASGRPALARALTLRLGRNRIAPLLLLAVVAAVLVGTGRFAPATTACVLLALAFNVGATLALQADLGLGRAGAWSARYPVQNAVLIAAVVALHATAGLDGAVAAVAVAGAAGFALALTATRSLWRAGPHTPVLLPAGAARFGLVAAAVGALTQLVQRGGVVAAALLSTADETGHAAVAIGVALAATYAVAQVFVVTLPALTARHAATAGPADGAVAVRSPRSALRGSPSAAEPALRRLAGLLLAVVLPVALLGVLAVGLVVPAVLGSAYADATAAFPPALAAVVLAPLTALTLQAAALRLRPGATLVAAAAGAVAFTAAAVAAVPAWGAVGAAGAMLTGTATAAVVGTLALGGTGWRLPVASLAGAVAVAGWGVFL
jgi:O-antigen/teichoic acid export membrane protein